MNILFDLDGTLTDSSPGIIRSIQHALAELGQPVPEKDQLFSCIGPPLITSFRSRFSLDETEAQEAVELYRERYKRVGCFESALYPGVAEMLQELHDQGHQLYLATAKPQDQVPAILAHFNIEHLFHGVYGAHPDSDHADKTALIENLIGEEGLDIEETLMVGDREYDISGAKNNGLWAVGALYGYGSEQELMDTGADELISLAEEMVDVVADYLTTIS